MVRLFKPLCRISHDFFGFHADFFYLWKMPASLFSLEKLPPCGGQRYLALPWSFVSKITNSKHPAKKTAGKQKTNKLQTTSTKFQINHKFQVANSKQGLKLFFYSFVCYLFFRSLEFICYLYFVIWDFTYYFEVGASLWDETKTWLSGPGFFTALAG